MKHLVILTAFTTTLLSLVLGQDQSPPLEAEAVSLAGHLDQQGAQFTISATLLDQAQQENKLLYTTSLQDRVDVAPDTLRQKTEFEFERVQGKFSTIVIGLHGPDLPANVTSPDLDYWSVRNQSDDQRQLVLTFKDAAHERDRLKVIVSFTKSFVSFPSQLEVNAWDLAHPSLGTGTVSFHADPSLHLVPAELTGLLPRTDSPSDAPVKHYRFHGTPYRARFAIAPTDPDAQRVLLNDLQLEGQLANDSLAFTLTGTATTKNRSTASLPILDGEAALTDFNLPEKATLRHRQGAYHLVLESPGSYPFQIQFVAKVNADGAWQRSQFQLSPAGLFPIQLHGFPRATEIRVANGGPFTQVDESHFRGFVPANGSMALAWKAQDVDLSTRLFFNTESNTQIRIGTGVLRQSTAIDLRVMQGELDALTVDVFGPGEITRVSAPGLLSWDLSDFDADTRVLTVRFNQPQTDSTRITINSVGTVGDFPAEVTPLRLTPQGSDRHHGSILVTNDGAVRLDTTNTSGLSRVTPEQRPVPQKAKTTAEIYPLQQFAFRHSSAEYTLTVQATMIQPEIGASALMTYHLDYEQTRIDADFELEIREAPIREFILHLPPDYVLADLSSQQMTDFFLSPAEDNIYNQLRIVFAGQIIGRHQIRLRLERNQALDGTNWTLGKISPQGTRQLRGHIGITSIEGYRITPGQMSGLTEIATVYFPQKITGLQASFRLTEAEWALDLTAAQIPQTILAEAFHMYTLGNGMISGSSLIHFDISGAPLDTLNFNVPAQYRNVEFTGEEVRNWSQDDNQYTVNLQSPIIGSYTLLATFERPFSDTADTLNAAGVITLNTTTEQGTIVVTSNRQIELASPADLTNLVPLTPEELSAENQLLVQQPVLAAYQYTQRPIAMNLAIGTLAEAASTRQIVDRAALHTRVARDGQTVTSIRYIVKTSGQPHLTLNLPADTQLWSATVDQIKVMPIDTAAGTLIPLPPEGTDLRIVEMQLAASGMTANPMRIELPSLEIPVLHTTWHLEAAPKQRLEFLSGSMLPRSTGDRPNGYRQLDQLFHRGGPWGPDSALILGAGLLLLILGTLLIRYSQSAQIFPHQWRRRFALALAGLSLLGSLSLAIPTCLSSLGQIAPGNFDLDSQTTITPAGTSSFVVIENRPNGIIGQDIVTLGWPLFLAVGVLAWSRSQTDRRWQAGSELAFWLLTFFGLLSWPIGGPLAVLCLIAFALRQLTLPAIQRLCRLESKPTAAVTTALLTLYLGMSPAVQAEGIPNREVIPDSIMQSLRIDGNHAFGTVTVTWQANANETISLLRAPGILTQIDHDAARTRLTDNNGKPPTKQLLAIESGTHSVRFSYQLPIPAGQAGRNEPGFLLPTQYGLINKLDVALNITKTRLVVKDALAVTARAGIDPGVSNWHVVPPPTNAVRIDWIPQLRDRSEEKAVYFAEWTHLITPSSGLVEGFHDLAIRPAQGELTRVMITLPEGITVNDVLANDLAQWRFAPDENRVIVDLKAAQSSPFLIRVLSQAVTQPLPYTHSQTFPAIIGASGQVGSVAISAEQNIQLGETTSAELVNIDPQDFPQPLLDLCRDRFPSASIRQAFRYTDPAARLGFEVNEVAPHITVTTSERISLGEDRILLASEIQARVTRAGVFGLSFALPPGLNIDSITGDQLSHWSELLREDQRIITLHLKQRWQGTLRFDLTLSGPGLTNADQWTAPKIAITEANRQRGQLVLIPEQGLRLQATTRDNTSETDARSQGFKTLGALAFDLLNENWNLAFTLEQVTPWIEVTSLQDLLFTEGKATVRAYLDCEIKNTAIKQFDLLLPANASNVRFDGQHLADAVQTNSGDTNSAARQNWTVRLDRRTIGNYRLTLSYQIRLPEDDTPLVVQGIQMNASNSQRGYLALRTEGRLQIAATQVPESLYPTDWNNVPRGLQQTLPDNLAISRSYRIVDPSFDLPVTIARHEVTPILPAQVTQFHLTSLISATGNTLTKASIKMIPGSKRSLAVTLPPASEFWFARVNNQGVLTWTQDEAFLVPLTQSLSNESETLVEFYYQTPIVEIANNKLNRTLRSFNIDVPANAIEWQIVLDPRWRFDDWLGDLELVSEKIISNPSEVDLDEFIKKEFSRRAGRNKQAEDWLAQGNQFLSEGNDQLARSAFSNAYGLTQHDAAFNEDARVQLRTVKTQQAMAGISVQQRHSKFALGAGGESEAAVPASAQQILAETDPALENNLLNLADRLIAQHDDPTSQSSGFDITLPTEGTHLSFIKNVQVDDATNLNLIIQARPRSGSFPVIPIVLIVIFFTGTVVVRHGMRATRD